MNQKNRGGREARKPKAPKNLATKGQAPGPGPATAAPGGASGVRGAAARPR